MRVISGSARGRKLLSLEGEDTRPTTDRVKESMFNLIMPYIRDARVLDLFAGSGALGLEALSRGAERCTFIENAAQAAEIVRKNLENTRLSDKSTVFFGNALAFLEKTKEKFSLIFLDPPYDGGFYTPVLTKILAKEILAPDGVLVLEKRAETELPLPNGLELIKDRKYGKTQVFVLVPKKKGE